MDKQEDGSGNVRLERQVRRGEKPVFLCQLEIDPRDPSAIIEELTEERDRYKDALARLYNAATSVRIFVNSRERIEQAAGKQWFEDELAAALASLKSSA